MFCKNIFWKTYKKLQKAYKIITKGFCEYTPRAVHTG